MLAAVGTAVGDVAHDGGVNDRRQAVGFLLEPFAKLRAETRRNFYRDGFAVGQIRTTVDHAHAASDAIAGDPESSVNFVGYVVRRQQARR